jgi:hypothetical protein
LSQSDKWPFLNLRLLYVLGINAAFHDPAAWVSIHAGGEEEVTMSKDREPEKKEIDANDVIREYVESADTNDEVNQTNMEWYEQANQDTIIPPDAVLAGGDMDAAWDQAASGEETVGGTTPTPDQDIVDEIGRAVGVEYEDAEPLHTTEKLERRDEQRWELHPASSEDFTERNQNYDKPAAPGEAASRSKRTPSTAKRGKRKAA